MNPEPDGDAHLRPPYPLPFALPNPFLDAVIKQCDDAIETMARISETPSRFITKDGRVRIKPCEPQTPLFHSVQTLELLVGRGVVPLCDRLIPSKGTE